MTVEYLMRNNSGIGFVRIPEDADISIKITDVTLYAGEETIIILSGKGGFSDFSDTVRFLSGEDDSEYNKLQAINTKIISSILRATKDKNLLMSYSISSLKARDAELEDSTDKWRKWIATVNALGDISKETSYLNYSLYGAFSIRRVTSKDKFKASVTATNNIFEYLNDGIYRSAVKTYTGSIYYAKGIGDNFAWRVANDSKRATYYNFELRNETSLGIEYSLFPYSTSQLAQMRFSIVPSAIYYDYYEKTIFERDEEWRGRVKCRTALDLIRERYSLSCAVSGEIFLSKERFYNIYAESEADINIFKGMNLEFYGNISFPRDQFYLKASEYSEEEILLKQNQMLTDYILYLYVGISYSFGSKFANVFNIMFD